MFRKAYLKLETAIPDIWVSILSCSLAGAGSLWGVLPGIYALRPNTSRKFQSLPKLPQIEWQQGLVLL
jgi:hypothetical protein